jgi:putative oxidoreductase
MAVPHLLVLPGLARMSDHALLAARVATGAFLVHGVLDNVVEPKRMAEFVAFMRANDFFWPEFWAPFSVYTQLAAGLLLILGLLTRWSGLIVVATFLTALWTVHWEQSFREWWPALSLVLIGGIHATIGAGRFSLDRALVDRSDA